MSGDGWEKVACGCWAEWNGEQWQIAATSFLCDHKQGDRVDGAPPPTAQPSPPAQRLRTLADAATPGPWRLGTSWLTIQRQRMQAVEGADGKELGHSWFLTDDARLIALAPELARWAADAAEALGVSFCIDAGCLSCAGNRERATPLLARLDALTEGDTA